VDTAVRTSNRFNVFDISLTPRFGGVDTAIVGTWNRSNVFDISLTPRFSGVDTATVGIWNRFNVSVRRKR